MVAIGYALMSEEHPAPRLVANAQRAEATGFGFALISDHYHPWTNTQGESPFVWSVLGAIAQATDRLVVGTGVTCPTMRIHPAIIAQAAATTATLMPGRFFLGVGSGENLNEHILGDTWPRPAQRIDMLEEAIDVIRLLWRGGVQSHQGPHYTVDQARIFSLPETLPPIMVASSGPKSGSVAARAGDGLVVVAPDPNIVENYREGGGEGPRIGLMHICWAESAEEARQTVMKYWPKAGISGALSQELPLPDQFEAAAETVREEDFTDKVACGPDPELVLEHVQQYVNAGCDHVCIHQIGPDQEGFFRFYERELAPRLQPEPARADQLAAAV